MASPVDGVVVSYGPLHRDTIEQVKGITYTISDFLSPSSPIAIAAADPKRYSLSPPFSPFLLFLLWQCTISDFLSPSSPPPARRDDCHLTHFLIRRFYQATIYLAPGDYHRVHAPTDYVLETRRIVPGRLVSVSQRMVSSVRGLFASNERVVLEGRWAHGLFAEV